jgi:hypothetical protein
MTRANLLIVVVLVVAVAALFLWVLTLQNQQAELMGSSAGGLAPRPEGDLRGRVDDLERTYQELSELTRSQGADLGRLETRLDGVEAAGAMRDEKIVALGAGQPLPDGGSGTAAYAGDPELRSAIEAVLDQKEEEERRTRLERSARGMARFLLADVDATEDQKERFVGIISGYLEGRDRIRREFSGDNADDAARDAALADLERVRNEEVQVLFGGDYAKIEERLNRTRRMLDGRRGAPRGDGGRGFRGRGR